MFKLFSSASLKVETMQETTRSDFFRTYFETLTLFTGGHVLLLNLPRALGGTSRLSALWLLGRSLPPFLGGGSGGGGQGNGLHGLLHHGSSSGWDAVY